MQTHYKYKTNNKFPSEYSIKSYISSVWRNKIKKAPDEIILEVVKKEVEWKDLRHDCTNYDELINSNAFKGLIGLERAVAYWTLHYYCTLFGLQEQLAYYKNRYESYALLVPKLRQDIKKLQSSLERFTTAENNTEKINQLEKELFELRKENSSLKRSVSQYKVWNQRYRDKLNNL